ncbi:MAG TPA: TolC family protein [Gemmatimonadales bacterium]|nr:TolC family protein [Gemmatimonadales bacterium]
MRPLGAVGAAMLALVLFAHGVAAQSASPETLTVAEATRIAREANPMLRAAHYSAEAAAQRIGPAGALPDPQLQFGLMNRMASQFGSTADPMTMNQVQLMQMLPWPGKLGNARRAAEHTADAARADADDQALMLEAQVRMAYYEVADADRALDVMRRTQGLLRDFLQVSTAMYAVGSAVQQDVLRAQVEVARMGEEITRMGQERVAMAARLNALFGREASVPVPALELPEPGDSLPPVDSLVATAQGRRPALRAGTERLAAADAALAGARRELFPDFQLGFAYQSRPAFPDMMSLMVGISLPIFAGGRQLPMRRQMAAMRDMSAAELLNLRNETIARIVETRARAVRDRDLVQLYRSSILPQAQGAVQAALSSYRVGRVAFMQLVDNQMTVNQYQIETLRLLADYQQALGELVALTGGQL